MMPLSKVLMACCCLLGALAQAQDTGILAGKVTDSNGVPIPGAAVSVYSGADKIAETLTDLDGTYSFKGLQPGNYTLTTDIVGFIKFTTGEVDASKESSRNIAVKLDPVPRPIASRTPSPVSEKRQEAGESAVLSFQTASVTDLPGLSQFQQDFPQESEPADSARSGTENVLFISGNTASMDAGSLNDPNFRGQIMDAARMMGFQIQEFGAAGGPGGAGEMGGFPIGGGPGGAMGFGMVGRGGRGASFKQPVIEGTLTESYSNSALNARNYSLTGQTLDKPVQIQNNFSLTVGGTIPFLKTKSTSRTGSFRMGPISQPGWSFTYGGSRNRSATDILTTVPTDLERSGDFSRTYVQTFAADAATGQPTVVVRPIQLYSNPHDASSRFTRISAIDPIAARLLEFIPRANLPCEADAPCVNNYAQERSLPTSSDQVQAGITGLKISSKDTIGINYSMRRSRSIATALFPGLDTTRTSFGQNIGISGTHTFKSRLNSNWRLSFNQMRNESANAFSYKRDVEGELGITGVSADPINWGPPTINFSNYGNISLAAPSLMRNQTLSLSAGLMKMGGNHAFRTGLDFTWNQRNSRSDSNGRGTFTFTGYATILADSQGSQVPGTGSDFADFLLGLPFSTSRRFVDPAVNPYGNSVYLRSRNFDFFVMDNWRVRSNLTVNYGVRYEYTGPSFEKYDRMVSLDANSDFSKLAQVFPGQTGPVSGRRYSRSIVNADRNNFAPRIGIAWKPKAGSPFVFRAGYGISYNPGSIASAANQLINQPPFAVTQTLATDRRNPLTLAVGFPENPDLTILNTFAVDPDYAPSYAQQWTLDIQMQLSRLYVLNVSYMGTRGKGLDILRAPKGSASASSFLYLTNSASSIYHGLNVQFSRRFSHGFNMRSSYTFSKSIDNTPGGGAAVAQNDADLDAERALSSQDQRHNFQTTFMYELPFGQNRAFFAGASSGIQNLISGWTFNGTWTLASGNPLTARYASSRGNVSGAALYNSLRADATGLPVSLPRSARTVQKFFNTAAFAIPAGQYGTAGRNTITGPGSSLVNVSMRKSVRLDESNRRLDISWQIQNLLNHPNWAGVSTTVNALNFGQVTSVRAMRSMTMDLRIRF